MGHQGGGRRGDGLSGRPGRRDPGPGDGVGEPDHADHPWRPPVGGRIAALAHDAVHGLDITVALGLPARLPVARTTALLAGVPPRTPRFFGARVDGVRLEATDADWSYGSGPRTVAGRAEHLLLVTYGRRGPEGLPAASGAGRFTASR
ncbi:hypothetical protein ACIQI7_01875 [Kitasatospora sp. NPDC092039]|uniref:hypothetical protein n=1 Tax=Kitasatospora sp. NPDC092039 TaxID=3364086 RepID=UPI0037F2F898